MLSKRELSRQNEYLRMRLEEQRQEIDRLNKRVYRPKNVDTYLNLKYLTLIQKYNKLMDSCLSNETKYITYNGELYRIQVIDFHKDTESVDTINIKAVHVRREKGLINDLAEPFKEMGKQLNKIFFGNENK